MKSKKVPQSLEIYRDCGTFLTNQLSKMRFYHILPVFATQPVEELHEFRYHIEKNHFSDRIVRSWKDETMDEFTIKERIDAQRNYFSTGATLPLSFRLQQLQILKTTIRRYENELSNALKADLGKSRIESYMCEIGLTLSELT